MARRAAWLRLAQGLAATRTACSETFASISVLTRTGAQLQCSTTAAGLNSSSSTGAAGLQLLRMRHSSSWLSPASQQLSQSLRAATHPPALAAAAAAGAAVPAGARGFSSSAGRSSQCDCPTLGGPTPDMVVVEYDEDEVDRFIALADAIEEAFPNIVVEGNPSGEGGRPGAFEVTGPNGALLFSRLSSGDWPQAAALVGAIGAAADAAAAAAAAGSDGACALPQQAAGGSSA